MTGVAANRYRRGAIELEAWNARRKKAPPEAVADGPAPAN